jgi:hypothetical protein
MAINNYCLQNQNNDTIKVAKWHYAMFHPECTFVAGSSVQWLSHPEDKKLPFNDRREHPLYPGRRDKMRNSVEFVKALYNSNIDYLDIENPVGILSTQWRKPTQIIQPYMFGDEATKTTCIWSKNLPLITPTNIVGKGNRTVFASGKSHPEWYAAARGMTKYERQELRSKTFPGIAKAFAEQRGNFLLKTLNNPPQKTTLFQ